MQDTIARLRQLDEQGQDSFNAIAHMAKMLLHDREAVQQAIKKHIAWLSTVQVAAANDAEFRKKAAEYRNQVLELSKHLPAEAVASG